MIPPKQVHTFNENIFQTFLKKIIFYFVIEKPFDPEQLLFLLSMIVAGVYFVKKKRGFVKTAGKLVVLASSLVLLLRILVVLYLALQS